VSRVCFEAPWSYYGALGGAGGLGGVKNKNRETKAFGNRELEGKVGRRPLAPAPVPWSTLASSARLRERSDLLSSRPPGSCSETKEYYEVILKESIVFLKTNDKRGTSVFLVKSSLKPCQSNAVHHAQGAARPGLFRHG